MTFYNVMMRALDSHEEGLIQSSWPEHRLAERAVEERKIKHCCDNVEVWIEVIAQGEIA